MKSWFKKEVHKFRLGMIAFWLVIGLILNLVSGIVIADGVYIFAAGMVWGALFVAGGLGWYLDKYCDIERKHPYTWRCKHSSCYFRLRSTDPTGVAALSRKHEHDHEIGLI